MNSGTAFGPGPRTQAGIARRTELPPSRGGRRRRRSARMVLAWRYWSWSRTRARCRCPRATRWRTFRRGSHTRQDGRHRLGRSPRRRSPLASSSPSRGARRQSAGSRPRPTAPRGSPRRHRSRRRRAPRRDAYGCAVAGERGERQSRQTSTSGGSGRLIALGIGWRQVHPELPGDFVAKSRSTLQARDHALANRRDLHLRQLEAERAQDMRLLHGRLAPVEERGLRVVVGELLPACREPCPRHLGSRNEVNPLMAPFWNGHPPPSEFGSYATRPRWMVWRCIPSRWLLWTCATEPLMGSSWSSAHRGAISGYRRTSEFVLRGRVIREVEPRHHVSDAERDLLRLREEVVRIAIQDQLPDRLDRTSSSRHDLRRQHVEAPFLGLPLREDLDAHFTPEMPARSAVRSRR